MGTRLLAIAGVLVFVSAAVHLALGVAGLAEAVSGGGSALLPTLYLLGGLVALALLGVLATNRPPSTATYAAGAGLMILFLLAYADVHAFGVAESTLGIDVGHDHAGSHADGHSHGHDDGGHSHDGHAETGSLTTLADHLRGDASALVSKTTEAVAAALFAALLVLDR